MPNIATIVILTSQKRSANTAREAMRPRRIRRIKLSTRHRGTGLTLLLPASYRLLSVVASFRFFLVSSIRCRVEHVFGMMTSMMDAMRIRCIGISRATGIIGLNNLVYNRLRSEQIFRLGLKYA